MTIYLNTSADEWANWGTNGWASWVAESREFRLTGLRGCYVALPLAHVFKYVGGYNLSFYMSSISGRYSDIYLGCVDTPKNYQQLIVTRECQPWH